MKQKALRVIFVWILSGVFLLLFPTVSQAAGTCDTVGSCPKELADITPLIARIIDLLAPTAAVAFLVMLIFGGYRLMASGGDPKSAAQARSILTYAVIGVILVVASWLILMLIGTITGVDVTRINFNQ